MKRIGMLLFLFLLTSIPLQAQDSANTGAGHGVVTFSEDGSTNCIAILCDWLEPLLYPRLFDVNPSTGALLSADASSRALAIAVPSDLPAPQVTLELSRDRLWSDGSSITTYDVLYSLLADAASPNSPYYPGLQMITGVRLLDDHMFTISYVDQHTTAATCDALPRSNITILPSRRFASGFRAFVDGHTPTTMHSLADWLRAYQAANLPALTINPDVTPTSGAYRWDGYDSDGNARFLPSDGQGAALEHIAAPADPTSAYKSFIAGSSNVLLNVPLDQRADLRTLASGNQRDFRVAEIPGRVSLVILLNFANPNRPLPGFHPVSGQPLDQGKNPFFSDLKVRQALQLAIDQKALVGGVLQRSALPLSSLFAPSSWAFDSTLPALQPNIMQAKQLLDQAGWIDNGVVRVCQGCGTAKDGTPMQFALFAPGAYADLINQIAEQWAEIGVTVSVNPQDTSSLPDQTFAAYLQPIGGNPYEDADPDRTLMLTPAGDMPGLALTAHTLDFGSFSDLQVTALLAQARTLPGCDPTARAALYHQLDRLLQSDLPFLYVAAPDEFYASSSNVIGFAPRAGDPLWNVESWVVAS